MSEAQPETEFASVEQLVAAQSQVCEAVGERLPEMFSFGMCQIAAAAGEIEIYSSRLYATKICCEPNVLLGDHCAIG